MDYVSAKAQLASHVRRCEQQGKTAGHLPGATLVVLRHVFERCPDQGVPSSVAGLQFLSDPPLREELRRDIAEV
jgi:hypothetical protein